MGIKVVEMVFGSHLYGTATAESDQDYKGIFMPDKGDLLLNRVPKSINTMTKKDTSSKNTADDVDMELYSLHYFIKLACEGQTVALDMLHAPDHMLVWKHPLWDHIVSERHRFYTKNVKAFVGYAYKQAAKYGIKGSRLSDMKSVIDLLSVTADPEQRLFDVWNQLPEGDHCGHTDPTPNGISQYKVCGKTLQSTQRVGYTLRILNDFYTSYGNRAMLAAQNKGIDWKALSHAVRAALQVLELLTCNTITFPLKEAELVRRIKQGEMDYTTEVAPTIERLMANIDELVKTSPLPAKVNRRYWDNFIVEALERYVL